MAIATGTAMLIGAGLAAGGSAYAANRQSGSANRGYQYQSETANRAADLEAQAARETLAFEKEREARRKAEFEQIQAKNLEQYNQAQARMEPYRALGRGAIGQLMQPIPGKPQPGSMGALMGGK